MDKVKVTDKNTKFAVKFKTLTDRKYLKFRKNKKSTI